MMSHFECLKVKRRNLIGVTLYIYPPVFDFLNKTLSPFLINSILVIGIVSKLLDSIIKSDNVTSLKVSKSR